MQLNVYIFFKIYYPKSTSVKIASKFSEKLDLGTPFCWATQTILSNSAIRSKNAQTLELNHPQDVIQH